MSIKSYIVSILPAECASLLIIYAKSEITGEVSSFSRPRCDVPLRITIPVLELSSNQLSGGLCQL